MDQSLKSQLNQEMYVRRKRREVFPWIIAILTSACAAALAIAIAIMMPLKTTEAYLGLVDQETGDILRAYQVDAASVTEREAVIESWIYTYVIDRETYDIHDQQRRLERIVDRSAGTARADFIELWSPGSPRYIRNVLPRDARVFVTISSITLLDEDTAQVRLQKRIVEGQREGTSSYIATLSYRFKPITPAPDKLIWENPFGFQVTNYRLDHQSEG